jgi:hypothetical protein
MLHFKYVNFNHHFFYENEIKIACLQNPGEKTKKNYFLR